MAFNFQVDLELLTELEELMQVMYLCVLYTSF
jgi:hypothetical protein